MTFAYGIEHEVAFINARGQFADFDAIIAQLPAYEGDDPQLRLGDAGIKLKRWYIEGFERIGDSEDVLSCDPTGIETRTTIHDSIAGQTYTVRATEHGGVKEFQAVSRIDTPVERSPAPGIFCGRAVGIGGAAAT